VYLAEHPALALLEVLVHHEVSRIEDLPKYYQLLKVEMDDSIAVADLSELPDDWKTSASWSKNAGTEWLSVRSTLLLKVPSVLVPYASNYLFNPAHPDAAKSRIVDATRVDHDPRILSLLSEPRA